MLHKLQVLCVCPETSALMLGSQHSWQLGWTVAGHGLQQQQVSLSWSDQQYSHMLGAHARPSLVFTYSWIVALPGNITW
jgi:hypothetical protein